MKSWRAWFLLLLAVLLPIRGAVAAAMLCPMASSGVQAEVVLGGHGLGHAAMDHAQAHAHEQGLSHTHAATASDGDGHPTHDPSGSDKCNLCSAYCSLTPLLTSVASLAEPLDLPMVRFADLTAPPPSFVSGGQERPPRTI